MSDDTTELDDGIDTEDATEDDLEVVSDGSR